MEGGFRGVEGLGLKVTGALAGTIFVESLDSTVGSLRAEVARLMGGDAVVKMIVGGRTLQDNSRTLREAGLTPASRILITRGAAADTGAAAAERVRRLERVRKAAEALAGRDARGLSDDYALDIEDQSGSSVSLKPEDRRNLVFGLLLHDKAKNSMKRADFSSALDELLLAEESLSLCDPALAAAVDNLPLLLLDLVWCAHKLGDARRLAVSRERLAAARAGLVRAHGAGLERLRTLAGGAVAPELATYLRLEVLEGLVGYYSGVPREAVEGRFRSAQEKWRRLQVSDEALAMLQAMGYGLQESRRGLRLSGGDVTAAVDFIVQQRKAKEERDARRQRHHDWNHERVRYGKTASGQYVDQEQLDRLTGLGFGRAVAAEALRKSDNKGQEALDELSAPERRRALELSLALKEGLQAQHSGGRDGTGTSGEAAGAANDQALAALKTVAEALAAAKAPAATGGTAIAGGSTSQRGASDAEAAAQGQVEAADAAAAEAAAAAAEAAAAAADAMDEDQKEVKEAEQELVRHVESDPMAAYDIDVSEEGDIIATFLTMLSTAAGSGAGPSGSGAGGSAGTAGRSVGA